MAFILDHTSSGNVTLQGNHVAFTGTFTFPLPSSPNHDYNLLSECYANIDSISGLQSCLDLLVPTSEICFAAALNAGPSACQALLVNNQCKIDDCFIPSSVVGNSYVVSNTGQLTLLNQAGAGAIATVTNLGKTYVLTGRFNNTNNWVPLNNPDNCVDCVNSYTGSVSIIATDLASTAGFGANTELALEYLGTGYISATDLDSCYEKGIDFDTTLADYASLSYTCTCLSYYETTGAASGTLGDYTNNEGTGALFSPYLLKSTTGSAALSVHNVGEDPSCILWLGESGLVKPSTIPYISITEVFQVSSESDLTMLSTATVGDIAVDNVHKKNYILKDNGLDCYSNPSSWRQFYAEDGSTNVVNGQLPDACADVLISSQHISGDFCGNSDLDGSITDALSYTVIYQLDVIEQAPYQSSGQFTGCIANYTTCSEFDSIAATKSQTGHCHAMSDVDDLVCCTDKMTAFLQGDLVSLNNSYSYKIDPESTNTSCGSVMLGHQSKAKNDYEVVVAAGKFIENGDAQVSEAVSKLTTSNSNWNTLFSQTIDENSLILIKADVVSRCYDSFTLEATIARNDSDASLEGEGVETIHSLGAVDAAAMVYACNDQFGVKVCSTAAQNWWVGNIEITNVKGSGSTNNVAGTYWRAGASSDWFDVSGSWFTENTFTQHATSLPNQYSNVHLFGATGAYVDLDSPSWVQPNSIDTTSVSDSSGICFYSQNSGQFNGTIYGNAVFLGNSRFA